MIENARTGEQIEFVTRSGGVLVMRSTWTRAGHRAVEHIHPVMQERFEVIEGTAMFRLEGEEFERGPGDVVVVEPGRPHLAWNPTAAPVLLTIEMRPPLRWEEFTTRLFAGEDPAALMAEYAEEVVLAPPGQ